MTHRTLKIAAITSVAMLASAGTVFAAGGENCDHKKKAAQTTAQTTALKTDAVAGQTAVLGASEKMSSAKMSHAKKQRTILSFEDALRLCTDKGADNLQACIDYKTGVTKAYKKPST